MKLRSSKNVHFVDESVDESVDDSLMDDNKIWLVVLILALFIINYLYGYINNTNVCYLD